MTRHRVANRLSKSVTVLAATLMFVAVLAAFIDTGRTQVSPPSPPRAVPTAPTVDVELVITVDVSLSMDLDEQRLQRSGYVAAFRHPVVIAAMTGGPSGRIAVTYIEWAGERAQLIVMPWRIIDSAATANAFADELAAKPISRMRMTSISSALRFSAEMLDVSGERGLRRVIDVSGDGPNNSGPPVEHIRDELVARGIIINGLPIILKPGSRSGFFDIADLDTYYRDCVIGGPGSFVIPIKTEAEFPTAIRQKLLLEIAGLEPPARIVQTQAQKSDCLIGEKMWRRYYENRFQE